MTTATTAQQTLAEIIDGRPEAVRVLEGYGLDYCCGGRRPLGEAAADRGIDPADVIASLDALAPSPPAAWTTMGPAELVDHLEATHHAYLHAELPRLAALAEKVVGVHGGRHPELADVQAAYRELQADLEPHLAKEEQVLFPAIRRLAAPFVAGAAPRPAPIPGGSLQRPISVMLAEHDRAGALLERLRTATDGYRTPEDGCASYRALYDGLAELEADTHLHVHKENNVLFPAVVALEAAEGGPS